MTTMVQQTNQAPGSSVIGVLEHSKERSSLIARVEDIFKESMGTVMFIAGVVLICAGLPIPGLILLVLGAGINEAKKLLSIMPVAGQKAVQNSPEPIELEQRALAQPQPESVAECLQRQTRELAQLTQSASLEVSFEELKERFKQVEVPTNGKPVEHVEHHEVAPPEFDDLLARFNALRPKQ